MPIYVVLAQSQAFQQTGALTVLFFLNVLWTVLYDTQYAMADYDDDKHLPIFTSVKWLGQYIKPVIMGLMIIIASIFWILAYYWGVLAVCVAALTSVVFVWQWQRLFLGDWNQDACVVFLSNNYLGALWLLFLISQYSI